MAVTIQSATVTLTAAQIKAWTTTPITIIPAQGAGTAIVVQDVVSKFVYGGTNAFTGGTGSPPALRYGSSTGLIARANEVATKDQLTSTANSYVMEAALNLAANPASSIENQAVLLFSNGSAYTGNAANNNSLVVNVNYYVVTL
jgi:hypothetical protein